jgi:hypothetical protein
MTYITTKVVDGITYEVYQGESGTMYFVKKEA